MYWELFVIYYKELNKFGIRLVFKCPVCNEKGRNRHNNFNDIYLENMDIQIFKCVECHTQFKFTKGKFDAIL